MHEAKGARLDRAEGGRLKERAARALADGERVEALRLLERLCGSETKDPELWLMLASARGQGGDFEAAVDACRHALALRPGSVSGWSFLGNAQAGMGQIEQAKGAYRKALELNPRDAVARNNLGKALAMEGDAESAIAEFRKVLGLEPRATEVHNNLGRLFKERGELGQAIWHFEQALAQERPPVLTYRFLGDLLAVAGNTHRAEHVYWRGIERFPADLPLHRGLAHVMRYEGRLDEALELLEGFERTHGAQPAATATRAEIHEYRGEPADAYALIRGLMDHGQHTRAAAETYTRICREHGDCEEAIALARRYLDNPRLDSSERETLHFALGKCLDQLERYDEAFEHIRQANELAVYKYDAQEQHAFFDAIVSVFSREGLSSLPRATTRSQRPVFIVGMPRSGTSLCEQILASHPEVCGGGERPDVEQLAITVAERTGRPFPHGAPKLTQAQVDELARGVLQRLNQLSDTAARITDKMPQNFRYLGLIATLFPGARIIHCRRSPMDTCVSIYAQNFNAMHAYSTDLRNLGHYYREYQRLMAHWESVLDIPMMTVDYEDLVADQERVIRDLVEFVGLPWDDHCLRFYEADRKIVTASYRQVRSPLYTSAIGRWRHYERYLEPLREALGI